MTVTAGGQAGQAVGPPIAARIDRCEVPRRLEVQLGDEYLCAEVLADATSTTVWLARLVETEGRQNAEVEAVLARWTWCVARLAAFLRGRDLPEWRPDPLEDAVAHVRDDRDAGRVDDTIDFLERELPGWERLLGRSIRMFWTPATCSVPRGRTSAATAGRSRCTTGS